MAVGFPGLFFDPDLGVGRGLVNILRHTITPRGAVTSVNLGNCFFGDDACETKMLEIDAETGFDGNINQFRDRDVSDVYLPTLGCESLVSKAQGASGGGSGFKIDQSARLVFETIAAANSNFAEKDAVATFITRNIAQLADLAKLYSTSGGAIPEFDTPPRRLPFESVFMDASQDIQIGISDSVRGATVAQKLVVGPDEAPGDFQIVDRVQAVLAYVKEIEG